MYTQKVSVYSPNILFKFSEYTVRVMNTQKEIFTLKGTVSPDLIGLRVEWLSGP
jgi:hypothetical protein